jgi:hypothetical protein
VLAARIIVVRHPDFFRRKGVKSRENFSFQSPFVDPVIAGNEYAAPVDYRRGVHRP